ncbi:hypothetical protein J2X67_001619 [Variovorax sp. 3319]|jgi:hypothetical protein|uniref:hypothetical protein n=1 Tax=Variovorax sp. 3319 TaxID=2817754 RepID=UPI00285B45EB|nr:hypothetical protein [Variovorax sp. 3319]MDR6887103.1 hypothetical protein [Variovorax sp. 3319]
MSYAPPFASISAFTLNDRRLFSGAETEELFAHVNALRSCTLYHLHIRAEVSMRWLVARKLFVQGAQVGRLVFNFVEVHCLRHYSTPELLDLTRRPDVLQGFQNSLLAHRTEVSKSTFIAWNSLARQGSSLM